MKRLLLCLYCATSWSAAAHATTIGVSMDRFEDAFLANVRHAIMAEAKAKGVTVQFADAEDDTGRQIGQVQTFIAQKVDAIIVNPVDTAATPKITQLAVAAKIPLVYVNRKPDEKALPAGVSYVGSNETVAGTLEAEGLVQCLGGKGNLVIIEGQLSNNGAVDRTAAIESVAAKHPDIKVVKKEAADWDRNQAKDLMTDWLSSGTKIDAVAANNDEMAIGAIEALKPFELDPKKICIGGIDATAAGLAEMGNGTLAVTVFQDAKGQGTAAVDTALKMAKGERVDGTVDIPFEQVTKDNFKTYQRR